MKSKLIEEAMELVASVMLDPDTRTPASYGIRHASIAETPSNQSVWVFATTDRDMAQKMTAILNGKELVNEAAAAEGGEG